MLGDLVNRGPQSLATLRRLVGSAPRPTACSAITTCNLLAVADRAQRLKGQDTLAEILEAPDRDALLHWLRRQRLAATDDGWLLVHAGVAPEWDADASPRPAREVEEVLTAPAAARSCATCTATSRPAGRSGLKGHDRLRFIVNALTRIRFCSEEGRLEFDTS